MNSYDIVNNAVIYGMNESIIGSKYPMSTDVTKPTGEVTPTVTKLATTPNGAAHDQFLTGINMVFDLTFSNKAWVEAERYRFLYFISSQSTMHRIAKLDLKSQVRTEYVEPEAIALMERLKVEYNEDPSPENYLRLLYNTPSGFALTAKMTANYRCLKTIYSQRKDHRLPEWRIFCKWLETLPHAEFITRDAEHPVLVSPTFDEIVVDDDIVIYKQKKDGPIIEA